METTKLITNWHSLKQHDSHDNWNDPDIFHVLRLAFPLGVLTGRLCGFKRSHESNSLRLPSTSQCLESMLLTPKVRCIVATCSYFEI